MTGMPAATATPAAEPATSSAAADASREPTTPSPPSESHSIGPATVRNDGQARPSRSMRRRGNRSSKLDTTSTPSSASRSRSNAKADAASSSVTIRSASASVTCARSVTSETEAPINNDGSGIRPMRSQYSAAPNGLAATSTSRFVRSRAANWASDTIMSLAPSWRQGQAGTPDQNRAAVDNGRPR